MRPDWGSPSAHPLDDSWLGPEWMPGNPTFYHSRTRRAREPIDSAFLPNPHTTHSRLRTHLPSISHHGISIWETETASISPLRNGIGEKYRPRWRLMNASRHFAGMWTRHGEREGERERKREEEGEIQEWVDFWLGQSVSRSSLYSFHADLVPYISAPIATAPHSCGTPYTYRAVHNTVLSLSCKQFLPAATARWSISALCQNEGGGGATNFGGMGNFFISFLQLIIEHGSIEVKKPDMTLMSHMTHHYSVWLIWCDYIQNIRISVKITNCKNMHFQPN